MRRVRKVTIAVSPEFYEMLNNNRQRVNQVISKRGLIGSNKALSFPAFTSLIVSTRKLPEIMYHDVFKPQKRRRN